MVQLSLSVPLSPLIASASKPPQPHPTWPIAIVTQLRTDLTGPFELRPLAERMTMDIFGEEYSKR